MNKVRKIIILILFLLIILSPQIVLADEASEITTKILDSLAGKGNASKIFLWAIGIGAIMAFGVITYSGVIWSLSGISEEKSHAKEWIKGAIEGLVLLIVAYVILYVINPDLVRL